MKWAAAATSSVVLALVGVVLLPLILVVTLMAGASSAACPGSLGAVTYAGPTVADLSPVQMQRAATIVATGQQMGLPDQGIVIALAVASQESSFRVLANDGKGGDLQPDQTGIAASLDLPHDGVGTDHGSLGVFQQQWPWWGPMDQLMDPAAASRLFYAALVKIDGWESLPVTVAAQRVQKSAYPSAYADDEPLARDLLEIIAGNYTLDQPPTQAAACTAVEWNGDVAFPLPADSGYIDQHNFGATGSHWESMHTGDDYSVACGTPVLAATAGVVEADPAQTSWAGPHFVKVSTGPGSVATWYAHLASSVHPGTLVAAGQQIGTVGDLGNAAGCHLHFEVHPTGGSIYQDPVDPTVWFAAQGGAQ